MHGKQKQEKFDGGADGIVLVARLDVAQEDRGARHAMELPGELVEGR